MYFVVLFGLSTHFFGTWKAGQAQPDSVDLVVPAAAAAAAAF